MLWPLLLMRLDCLRRHGSPTRHHLACLAHLVPMAARLPASRPRYTAMGLMAMRVPGPIRPSGHHRMVLLRAP